MTRDAISRRDVLRNIGAGAAGTALATGTAAADRSDRYVIGTASRRAARAARGRADQVGRELDFGGIGQAVAGRFPEEAVEALRQRADVRYVEQDGTMQALAQTTPWGIDRVDADVAHDEGETGAGADVAIVDTGIDSDHPDLEGNLGEGAAFGVYCGSAGGGCRYGGSPNDNTCHYDWDDDNDHGSHCAGSADAIDNTEGVVGVSTEATLHAVKVLDGCGSGSYSDIAAGIEWVADQGYDVASMSLGGSDSSTVRDACQYAYNNGVLLVAAAGNDGPCTDCVGYPAAYDTVVAVSATSEDDSLADFSSTGPEVELAAPGEDVYSTIPGGYDTFSGTSMACPHVSGAGGQLMANGYTNTEARQRLGDTAEDIGLADNEQGNGLLDVAGALGISDGGDTTVAVSTGEATNVGDTSATLNGDLTDLGGADSADVYFEYGPNGGSLSNATSAQTLSSTGSFSDDVSGLDSDTEYEFRAVAEASDGDSDTGNVLTFTTGGGTGGTAPTIDTFAVTDRSNGGWARFEVDWTVSDVDGDLSTVDLTLSQDGTTVDSSSYSVGGSEASGSTRLQEKKGSGEYDITLTVTDAASNTTSSTKTRTASQ